MRYRSFLHRRLSKLETIVGNSSAPQIVLRAVISTSGKELNLQTSTGQRIVNGNGTLTELVTLDGCRSQITDQELDQFVAGFTGFPRDNAKYR